jgi:hypothetical protein
VFAVTLTVVTLTVVTLTVVTLTVVTYMQFKSKPEQLCLFNHFYCPTNALNYTKLRG